MNDDQVAEMVLAVLMRLEQNMKQQTTVTRIEVDRVTSYCDPALRYDYKGEAN